jgi:mono/diheme cytochrome c family protein
MAIRKGPEWLFAHARDPEAISPGMREPAQGAMSEAQARSLVSYARKIRAGAAEPPPMPAAAHAASVVLGRYCVGCHMIDGEGGSSAPDLTVVGRTRDAAWLAQWINAPEDVDPAANMPAFGGALSAGQLQALVGYLAARK